MSGAWSALRWKSPVGVLTVAGEGDWVTGLWIEGQKYFGASAPSLRRGSLPVLEEARRWLERYFAGEEPGPTPALAPHGTPFQQSVWSLLRTIPRGETVTYGTLAQRLSRAEGRTTSPRAVGSAVGRNPISILIPCHRVVGADGSLTGYAGGVEKKEWLLELEKAI